MSDARPADPNGDRMTRRQLFQAGGTIATTAALSTLFGCNTGGGTTSFSPGTDTSVVTSSTPLPPPLPAFVQPPTRASREGVLDTTLTVRYATHTLDGKSVLTRTFEGMIGGPTLRVKPGDTLLFNLVNALPPNPDQDTVYPDMNTPRHFNSTNNHVHGLHVSPSGNSDNVFLEIDPGNSFQYEYKIPADHPAGTFWYHPHKHGSVSMQMFGGMAGALIVEGGLDNVPEIAQMRDLVYLINELNIDPNTGQVPDFLPSATPNGPNAFPGKNRIMTVNGEFTPTLYCRRGEIVRLRVINATPRAPIPFFIDGHDLHIVSLDGITLPRVRPTTTGVMLAPANRADILVQAQAPGTYAIKKLADDLTTNPGPELLLGYLVVVDGTPSSMSMPGGDLPVPASLPNILTSELNAPPRTVIFGMSPVGPPGPPNMPDTFYPNFTIDGNRFDPDVIGQNIRLNAVEEWTLVNTGTTFHPFHIHINPFQVIAVNGVPLQEPEWHDTVLIPKQGPAGDGTVTIRHRFVDFTGLYVLHCHILVHEDTGMMQTVNVYE